MAGLVAAEDPVDRLRAQCAAVGFDLDKASRELVDRMCLLAEHSKTFDDATRMSSYAHRVFRHYELTKPSEAFTDLERQTVVLACLFSDIGKTGPDGADEAAQHLIIEMFSVENVSDDRQSIAHFLETYFPSDWTERLDRFSSLGLDPTMSVRAFWNLHSGWTLGIVERAGLPLEAVAAAATHHLLDDVNPQRIVGEDDHFTRKFGQNAVFDRAEKLVILLDKYDALERRGRRTHDQAIAWLRDRIAKNPRFHDDAELSTLLADIDTVFGAPKH